jgi:hypothetical protein
MPAEPTKPKLVKAQKIAVVNQGGYAMWARAQYVDKDRDKDNKEVVRETKWTDDYPNPSRRVIDMSTANGITTGCRMWPEMAAMVGRWAKGTPVEYAPNGHTVTYVARGATVNPWLEIVE